MDDLIPISEEDDDNWGSPVAHMIAGALAGTAEHCGMYPIDVVKTHKQASFARGMPVCPHPIAPIDGSMYSIARTIVAKHGPRGLFRGLSAVLALSAPAHAVSFSVFEHGKHAFGANARDTDAQQAARVAAAGLLSTFAHDAVVAPMDALKQRMQLQTNDYRSLRDCLRVVSRLDGLRSLYAGYTTTLAMNLPYSAIYFVTYDQAKKRLRARYSLPASTPHTPSHLAAGACAGVLAAAVTNPMDVVRTRLQLRDELGMGEAYRGMLRTARTIASEEGARAFAHGLQARTLFHACSGAITWTVYEHTKHLLADRV